MALPRKQVAAIETKAATLKGRLIRNIVGKV